MRQTYTTDLGFAHAVRYNDAMVRAWAARTGRMSKRNGCMSYMPEDLARECPHIDVPTNDDRGRAEVIGFITRPLQFKASYFAYLTSAKPQHVAQNDTLGCHPDMWRGVVTTWNGELLAVVTRITSYRALTFGRDTGNERGSFWAIGIDGRTYYGTHTGRGMYCRMRLAKYQDEYDIEQHTTSGWETVSSERTLGRARSAIREYRENQPELSVRVKHRKVPQT